MSVQETISLSGILIALVVVVWIIIRQSSWRAVRIGKLWILPVILVGDGIVNLAAEVTVIPHYPVRSLDASLLILEMALSFVAGGLMGVLAQFRRAAPALEDGSSPQRERWELESRTGWVAIVLWIIVVLVRVGIGIWGTFNEATLVESGGGVLLVLGLNRAARGIVLDWRARRLLRTGRPDHPPAQRAADEALMRAKRHGRDRVATCADEKTLKSNYYRQADLERLAELSWATDRSEDSLLREALEDLLDKHEDAF